MAASLEETLILVWRQVMVEDTKAVALGEEKFSAAPGPTS